MSRREVMVVVVVWWTDCCPSLLLCFLFSFFLFCGENWDDASKMVCSVVEGKAPRLL